jgi:hypothetical protein
LLLFVLVSSAGDDLVIHTRNNFFDYRVSVRHERRKHGSKQKSWDEQPGHMGNLDQRNDLSKL